MALRVGFITSDHLHFWSYLTCLAQIGSVEVVGIWEQPGNRHEHGLKEFSTLDELLKSVDAVIIVSQNMDHADHIEQAAKAGKAILCEKPVIADVAHEERVRKAVESAGVPFMTAFPCRYAPSFQRLLERVRAGDIGEIKSICATNHGIWPEQYADWFVDPKKSGGGALVDHVVHAADLIYSILGEEATRVTASVSHNSKEREGCEDSGLVMLDFSSGVFATIDSSWSRPENYRIWGDVTLNVVGEKGVLELNMFSQNVTRYLGTTSMGVSGYGSDNDLLMVQDWVQSIADNRSSKVTLEDGLRASRAFLDAYKSLALA